MPPTRASKQRRASRQAARAASTLGVRRKSNKDPLRAIIKKMARTGIQRSGPASMTGSVATMIADPCTSPLVSGGFGYQPTSINRLYKSLTVPSTCSPPTAPFTCGFVIWFPAYSTPKLQDAVPTVGQADGSCYLWAASNSTDKWLNIGAGNTNPSSQFGRGIYEATSTNQPLTCQSIGSPDFPFMSSIAANHQLVAACIDIEYLGPALSAGGEVIALNGIDPSKLLQSNYMCVDDLAVIYGSNPRPIRTGSKFKNTFFSRSPNATRRLTVGEGVYNQVRSTTSADNLTVNTNDTDLFTPLGFGLVWRNVPIAAVPGSATAISTGVKDLRIGFTVIKEWNAAGQIGLGQHTSLPGPDVHATAVTKASNHMKQTTGSSFTELGQSADRIMADPSVRTVINESVRIGTRFRDNRD